MTTKNKVYADNDAGNCRKKMADYERIYKGEKYTDAKTIWLVRYRRRALESVR